jgi:hypothetical protein
MDTNMLTIYRIFAVLGAVLLIKQIIFLVNKPKNSTYAGLLFWLSAFLWIMTTIPFVLVDVFGKPDGLNTIESNGVLAVFYVLLSMQISFTILLYLFSGKYAEYHIVYNPKKRKEKATINYEESYLVLYGMLKLKKKKIFIRDIVVEESYYVHQFLQSNLFPYAAMIGAKEYLSAKLVDGKTVKISNQSIFLSGDCMALIKLIKTIGIKYVS